jgi:hypothetical protein
MVEEEEEEEVYCSPPAVHDRSRPAHSQLLIHR